MSTWKDILLTNAQKSSIYSAPKKTVQQNLNNPCDDEPEIKIKKVPKEMGQRIIKARIARNLKKRSDLAKYLSISEDYIRDCETGGTRPPEKIMNKIMTFLNQSEK